jgi:Trk K+ transport system NAD-binding subunit
MPTFRWIVTGSHCPNCFFISSRYKHMDKRQRRISYYLVGIIVIVLVYTVLYHYGMRVYEDEPASFLHSLQVVVETFTTTGYGSDAPWETPEMNIFIIIMDITGVVLIFMALPVLVFPLFEDALSTTVPTAVEDDLSDHVIICTYTPRGETLIAELDSWDVDYVIIEPDRDQAVDLYETGYTVIHENPASVTGLTNARLPAARAVVADASDQIDASIVLTAKEIAEAVRMVSVVAEPDRAIYHQLAGADVVLSPRQLLGESLAGKVTTAITTDLGEAIAIGEDFEVAEFPVHRGSDLVGRTLAESGIREHSGTNVIGAWFRGEFEGPPSPDAVIDEGTVLLVTGRESQLEQLKELTLSSVRRFAQGETIIVGYGDVGATVTEVLGETGVPCTVVDQTDSGPVDVVGDATEPEVLREAGAETARTIILALPDDTAAQFTTLIVRDLNPDIEIIARADESEAMAKMYRAGADYVLSLATVSGRMLASTILEDEDVVSLDTQVQVIRTTAPHLAGQTLGEAQVRSQTGCTVVGVERNGEVITNIGPEFRINAGDVLLIAGTDEGTNQFTELMN